MDNVFAQIKTTELKGSTFRSRILDFGDFDISGAEFRIVFKKAGNILPLTDFAPQKVENTLVIPYNILESYSGEIRMEAWMTLNGVTDLALVDTMLISAENQLKSDATNQNVSVTFGDVVIPVTFTQAIVNIGGENGTGVNGKSAYEIAVDNGFVGTEAEWLISLKGADGEDFTYEDFTPEQLALLKGDKGDSFEYSDFTPEQLALLKGADGKSAYQIALDNGFEGTEAEWLASLQGSGGGGTAPSTTFNPTNNTAPSTMKAAADYFLERTFEPMHEIPVTLTGTNQYIAIGGNLSGSANYRTSNFIDVSPNGKYVYYGRTNVAAQAAPMAVGGYNAAGALVAIILGNGIDGTNGYPFTIPAGVNKIRICTYLDIPLRLTTQEISYYTLKRDLAPSSNKSWGAIGTSITWQDGKSYTGTPTGVEGIARGYQTLVGELLKFKKITNYGYSGNSLGGTAVDDALSILTKTDIVTHDIFTMESITNDFRRDIPIGSISDYNNNTGITTYYGALRVFKDKMATLNSNAIIIVANALKRNNSGYTSTSTNTVGHTMIDYEKALMAIAKLNAWHFIDQYRESGITDENLSITTRDNLHPNDFGYSLLMKIWYLELSMVR